jgi:hypothetical protein
MCRAARGRAPLSHPARVIGADDGNRTRVLSLGIGQRLNASCLRMGSFTWSPFAYGPSVLLAVVPSCTLFRFLLGTF